MGVDGRRVGQRGVGNERYEYLGALLGVGNERYEYLGEHSHPTLTCTYTRFHGRVGYVEYKTSAHSIANRSHPCRCCSVSVATLDPVLHHLIGIVRADQ